MIKIINNIIYSFKQNILVFILISEIFYWKLGVEQIDK